jgi:acyl carrier protein
MSSPTKSAPIDWNAFRDIIAEVTGVDLDEVVPKADFFADLGGESIDILDFDFRCQKAFGVATNLQRFSLSTVETDADGCLTEQCREDIVRRVPGLVGLLPTEPFEVSKAFRVEILYALACQSPKCGAEAAVAAGK